MKIGSFLALRWGQIMSTIIAIWVVYYLLSLPPEMDMEGFRTIFIVCLTTFVGIILWLLPLEFKEKVLTKQHDMNTVRTTPENPITKHSHPILDMVAEANAFDVMLVNDNTLLHFESIVFDPYSQDLSKAQVEQLATEIQEIASRMKP